MKCPQCGAETPDEEWNCVNCRINVYWASQHFEELAKIRARQGLTPGAATPPFLVRVHNSAMGERVGHGGDDDSKVRQIARSVMARSQAGPDQSRTVGPGPGEPETDE